jgi:hypothetical protein
MPGGVAGAQSGILTAPMPIEIKKALFTIEAQSSQRKTELYACAKHNQ